MVALILAVEDATTVAMARVKEVVIDIVQLLAVIHVRADAIQDVGAVAEALVHLIVKHSAINLIKLKMKKQIPLVINDGHFNNAIAFINELQRANLLNDKGFIEYDTNDASAEQKLNSIFAKYRK